MFDQLLDLVKEHLGMATANNNDVPADQHAAVAQATTGSIMDTLKNLVSGGNLSQLTDLFRGQNSAADVANHPVTQNATSDLVTNLMNKVGLNSDQASNVANSIVPAIMNKLVNKTNDPNDNSFNIQGILSSLGGSGGGGIMDKISGLFGK